jgi:uncharacterized protein YegL
MESSLDQVPFSEAEFAENPEPRCPCILLLDTSGSMKGQPIKELNEGIEVFKDELAADALAAKRAEIAVVTFGPVQVESDFQTAGAFSPPTLSAGGVTPMGEAIQKALEMVEQRKNRYRQNGIAYYRPWIFLITDGAPTDEWQTSALDVEEGEKSGSFSFFAVGVENADMEVLGQIATRQPLKLKGLQFRDLFVWLSKSMRRVSESNPGDSVPLENPANPDGWAEV